MTLAEVARRVARDSLDIFGAFHTIPADDLGATLTVILLGPREPGFWRAFTASPEANDGRSDPLDRWSRRVIEDSARELGAQARFPFGEPVQPFLSWAVRSGRAWPSPVQLLVHDTAGLWVSYRGALLLPERLTLPDEASRSPCETCPDKPCKTACPVNAIDAEDYDLAACHGFLDTTDGQSCMTRGCAVRRACPQSQKYHRVDAQSAFHMDQFHPCR